MTDQELIGRRAHFAHLASVLPYHPIGIDTLSYLVGYYWAADCWAWDNSPGSFQAVTFAPIFWADSYTAIRRGSGR